MIVSFWFTRRPRESAVSPSALYPRRTNCWRKGCHPGTTLIEWGSPRCPGHPVPTLLFWPAASIACTVLFCGQFSWTPGLLHWITAVRGQAVKKNGKTGKRYSRKREKRERFRSKKRFPFPPFFTVFNTFFLPFFTYFYKRENLSESERRAKKRDKKES